MYNKMNGVIIKDIATIIGYIDIVISFESYKKVKNKYLDVKEKLLNILSNDISLITYEDSLKIHTILDDVKEEILFNKEIGNEKIISDDILVLYEAMIKKINSEGENINGKR